MPRAGLCAEQAHSSRKLFLGSSRGAIQANSPRAETQQG